MAEYETEPAAPTTATAAVTAKSRYESLDTYRQPFLNRAREAAKLTIPSLMPPAGSTGSTVLPTPFQSVGAKGLLNLAAKLMLALFPPGSAFFRLQLDPKVKNRLKAASDGTTDPLAETESALAASEQTVMDRFEQKGARIELVNGLRQLICSGNVLLYILPDGATLAYRMDKYVVKRDWRKEPLEIILEECFSRASLPPLVRALVEGNRAQQPAQQYNSNSYQDDVYVYTRVYRRDRLWYEYQEVEGVEIPGTRSTYPLDSNPWLPIGLNIIPGEDYGRGIIEEHIGDLYSLEALRQSIVEGAGQAAKVLWLTNPNGSTDAEELARKPNGSYIEGKKEDVTALTMDKYPDFQFALQTAQDIEKSLGEAFLLGSAARRDAERVTAEEIRLIAGELEQGLGGIYSALTQSLQLPLVRRLMLVLQRARELPPLPKDVVKPQIVTGLAALGRNADLQKLDVLTQGIAETFGPEAVSEYINVGDYAKRRATALSLDATGLVRSEEEVQASREQKARLALAQKLGPNVINASAQQAAAAQDQAQQPQQ